MYWIRIKGNIEKLKFHNTSFNSMYWILARKHVEYLRRLELVFQLHVLDSIKLHPETVATFLKADFQLHVLDSDTSGEEIVFEDLYGLSTPCIGFWRLGFTSST